jgi:hypothetical protein
MRPHTGQSAPASGTSERISGVHPVAVAAVGRVPGALGDISVPLASSVAFFNVLSGIRPSGGRDVCGPLLGVVDGEAMPGEGARRVSKA